MPIRPDYQIMAPGSGPDTTRPTVEDRAPALMSILHHPRPPPQRRMGRHARPMAHLLQQIPLRPTTEHIGRAMPMWIRPELLSTPTLRVPLAGYTPHPTTPPHYRRHPRP